MYLGLPLGAKSRATSKWDKVTEIIKATLSTWKRGLLTKVGNLTLIKNVLLGLPVYYFSLFLPLKIIKQIEPTICNFLWPCGTMQRVVRSTIGLVGRLFINQVLKVV